MPSLLKEIKKEDTQDIKQKHYVLKVHNDEQSFILNRVDCNNGEPECFVIFNSLTKITLTAISHFKRYEKGYKYEALQFKSIPIFKEKYNEMNPRSK